MPSLDVYSFGLVVLFLFSERNWWGNANQSSRKPPQLPSIGEREHRVKVMLRELEGLQPLQKIAQQIRRMLGCEPKKRPAALDCVFELCEAYHDALP